MTEKLLKEIKKHNESKVVVDNPGLELAIVLNPEGNYTPEQEAEIEATFKEVKKEVKKLKETEMKDKVIEVFKEIKQFGLENEEDKFKLSKIEDAKILENVKKKIAKKQFEKITEKELKAISESFKKHQEDVKFQKELAVSKYTLESEGIEVPATDDEIISKAKEILASPKYPFSIRLYGDDVQYKFNFEDGKRYQLKDIKATVTKEYFELKKAEFEYDKDRNSVYITMSSSQKG